MTSTSDPDYAAYLRGKFSHKPGYTLASTPAAGGFILREAWQETSMHARGGNRVTDRVRWYAVTADGRSLGMFTRRTDAADALDDTAPE